MLEVLLGVPWAKEPALVETTVHFSLDAVIVRHRHNAAIFERFMRNRDGSDGSIACHLFHVPAVETTRNQRNIVTQKCEKIDQFEDPQSSCSQTVASFTFDSNE